MIEKRNGCRIALHGKSLLKGSIYETDESLQAAADLVPVCESMADIGTDHGYLPIYLVQEGRAKRAIACDVNDGPLTRAREDVSSSGLSRQIGLRLGGGLAPLGKGEVDGVTICGMGGLLMRDILVENEEKAQALSWLVLQPQGHVAELRQFLGRHHFRIEKRCFHWMAGSCMN